MFSSRPGVKRPVIYTLAALFGIAIAMPMAVSSGQMQAGGIFDECFESSCDSATMFASAE